MSIQQTAQEIHQKIEAEWATFQNSPWPGVIPMDIVTIFKTCLMESPPMKHQIHVKKLKEILAKEKTPKTLTYIELGLVINLILNSPLYLLSEDLTEALTKLERLEKARHEYNESAKEKETQLIAKKDTMLKLLNPGGNNGKLQLVN